MVLLSSLIRRLSALTVSGLAKAIVIAMVLTVMYARPPRTSACYSLGQIQPRIPVGSAQPCARIAQDDDDSDETEVPPQQVEQYVEVYKAMQRDRSLTIEQAAARQGLTLQSFRDLESRVERDDAALQRARDELQAAAAGTPSPATPSQ